MYALLELYILNETLALVCQGQWQRLKFSTEVNLHKENIVLRLWDSPLQLQKLRSVKA